MAGRRIAAGVLAGALAASLIHPRLRPTLLFGLAWNPPAESRLPTSAFEAGEWVVRALQDPTGLSADEIRTISELARAGAAFEPDNGFWWSTLAWGLEGLGQKGAAARARAEAEAVGAWQCPAPAGAAGPEADWRAVRCRRALLAVGAPSGPAPASGLLAGLPAAFLASGLILSAGGVLAAAGARLAAVRRTAGPVAASLSGLLAAAAALQGHLAPSLVLGLGALAWPLGLRPEPGRGVPRGVAAGIIALLAAATSAVWAWKLMDLAPPGAAGSPTAAGWAAAAALLSPLPGSLLILPGQPDRGKHLLRMMAACWAWAGAASLAGALIALAAASVLGAIPHAEPSTMVMESER